MPNADFPRQKTTIATVQIIVVSIVVSTVFICGLFLIMKGHDPDDSMMLTIMMAGISLPQIAASLVIPNLIAKTQLQNLGKAGDVDDDHRKQVMMQVFSTKTIIAVALLEGGGLMNAIAYFIEGHAGSILLAALFAGLCLTHFPTQSTFDQWCEKHSS